jgi:hypothetical protein
METDPAPNAAQPKPPRRWYQFRLRTLLIGVALLSTACGFVAHEAKIVRERNAMIEHIGEVHGDAEVSPDGILGPPQGISPECAMEIQRGDHSRRPSALRIWLGDQLMESIEMKQRWSTASEAKEIGKIFPESQVILRRDAADAAMGGQWPMPF